MYPYLQTRNEGRRIDKHRLIMEEIIGRRLNRFEFVHHKNGWGYIHSFYLFI